jgi:hypothetical protein
MSLFFQSAINIEPTPPPPPPPGFEAISQLPAATTTTNKMSLTALPEAVLILQIP